MKYNFITAPLLLLLCMQHTVFAMDGTELEPIYKPNKKKTQSSEDTTPITTKISVDEMVATIDAAINKKYENKKFFFGTFSLKLTEKDAFDIIHIMKQCYSTTFTPSDDVGLKLYYKNDYFKQAMEYFENLASKNINNVTINTLETIQNPEVQQPTPQLNQLPKLIKSDIMNRIYKRIKYEYDIILSGHTDTIRWYDICHKTDQVATSSEDEKFCLWDLKTGKHLYTFPEKAVQGAVYFNSDGSQIATATLHQPGEIYVKIWDTASKNLLHTIQHASLVNCMNFMQKQSNTTFDTFGIFDSENSQTSKLSLYALHKDTNTAATLLWTTQVSSKPFLMLKTHDENYRIDYPDKSTTLKIIKENCHSLYLCDQAIKNTRLLPSLHNIVSTNTYQQLTKYEKEIINKKLAQRITELQAITK